MVNVIRHRRITKKGVSTVKKHDRKILKQLRNQPQKPFNKMPNGTFSLPIQQAVLVPSTNKQQKFIGTPAFKKRTKETEDFLAKLYGGFTKTEGLGGYSMDKVKDKPKLGKVVIKERANMVTAFSQKQDFEAGKKDLRKYLKDKKKKWGQDSMGVITENNLFYV